MYPKFLFTLTLLLIGFWSGTSYAANHCVVLQYHHFSANTPRITSVMPNEFRAHIEYLEQNDFVIMPLHEVVGKLQQGLSIPDKCIALTVDDAYDSIYELAFPLLREKGWPLTVFVNTESIDDGTGIYLTWDQMRELAKQGVRFENHTHSHTHLIRRQPGEEESSWLSRIRNDIQTAQRRIKEELGQTATLFAYPYGEYDDGVKTVVKQLGLSAFGQQSGPMSSSSDFLALPRFPMAAAYAAMPSFKTKVKTLALPIMDISPNTTVLAMDQRQPQLTVTMDTGDYRPKELRCYVSGQGQGEVQWLSDTQFTVTAKKPLGAGRNRYNCTSPSNQSGRYYWFSHTWIRRLDNGNWYKE